MGFIGSIGNAFKGIGNIVKPLAQAAIKGIAPAATNMLKSIVGSGFDGVLKAAQGYVSRLPFIGDLASKLLGQGAEALKGMAFGGIDKLVGDLVNKLTPQTINGQTVTTPTLANRGARGGLADHAAPRPRPSPRPPRPRAAPSRRPFATRSPRPPLRACPSSSRRCSTR